MWPVEVYSKEFLLQHPYAQLRLRYNADSAKFKSSFGDDMAIIYKAWSATDETAKVEYLSSKKNFVNFLNRLLPTNTSLTSWLPLLKHPMWSYWMEKFVSHPWGRHVLVASQVTVAFACHHPRPFFDLFDNVTKWFEQYFPGIYHLIDAEDMNMFIERSTHFARSSNMRALFYPVWPGDFSVSPRHKITGDLHRLNLQTLKNAAKNKTDPNFPALSTPVTINGVTYEKRRPDFLSSLTDTQYHELFNRLRLLDESAEFPKWQKVMRDDTQHTCEVFSSVMRHVLTWVDPAAKPPASNSPDVISYTWDHLMRIHAMPRRRLAQVFMPEESIRQDPKRSAEEMVQDIWKHCSLYARDFLSDDIRSTVSFIPLKINA